MLSVIVSVSPVNRAPDFMFICVRVENGACWNGPKIQFPYISHLSYTGFALVKYLMN